MSDERSVATNSCNRIVPFKDQLAGKIYHFVRDFRNIPRNLRIFVTDYRRIPSRLWNLRPMPEVKIYINADFTMIVIGVFCLIHAYHHIA